jgi:chromatin segregation and condensation protein Rec8/ScpA/Scc1 (kleisin family)
VERWKRFERGSFSEMLLEESLASEEITGGHLLEDVGLWDLFEVFARLMSEVTLVSSTEIIFDEITLEESVAEVEHGLRISGRNTLKGLLQGRLDRASAISLFLAILELAKRHVIKIAQIRDHSDIEIRLQEPEPEVEASVAIAADVEAAVTEPTSTSPAVDASLDADS